MKKPIRKYTSSEIHWQLARTQEIARRNGTYPYVVHDEGHAAECCCNQALFCPYYSTIEGALGADWGIIVNPESYKFGQLVFEHAACGCPRGQNGHVLHPEGDQLPDCWHVDDCLDTHEFKNGQWTICVREVGHAGYHRDHNSKTWK